MNVFSIGIRASVASDLATGPSIREQDLTPLRDEWCIAVSEFYKHKDYGHIKPAYYAFAPCHPPFTDEDVLRNLAEMKERSHTEVFFFGMSDKSVVERSDLVTDWERVHYLHFRGDFVPERIDLEASLPGPYGAGIMGAWIAIYMGFSEIYLIGCDHAHLWKWDGVTPFTRENYYQHFFQGAPSVGYEPMDLRKELRSALKTRDVYCWTSEVASHQGTRIYNANPRNYLNVLPGVSLAGLFEPSEIGVLSTQGPP